ncbi:MAG: hypothetical protein HRU03_03665 [Nanoarchaeales archaeon]|nr:hypothetical protein [Nanoarchaeales archaeon]
MNKFFKIINYIFLILITINLGFSSIEEFEFKLEFEHDFDNDDYTIECDITYDGRDKTIDFDKDTNEDDLEYSKKFKYDLEVDCDEDVDEITLYIYNEDDKRIDKIKYEDDDSFEYYLDLVDKKQDWFEIEITDRFRDDNECTLKVDNEIFDYKFNDDTDSKRLTIQKNYDKTVRFTCDNELSKLEFKAFDNKNNILFNEQFEDSRFLVFDKQILLDSNQLNIELKYDFNLDNSKSKLICKFEKNDITSEFEFKADDTLEIDQTIDTKFTLSCNDKIEEIKFNILDKNDKKLIEKIYANKKIINYQLYLQDYLFELKIKANLSKTTYCTQNLDDNKNEQSKKYTYNLDQINYNVKASFDKVIEFHCTNSLDKVTLYVYPNDKTKSFYENSKNVLFSKTFGKDKTIDYTLDKSKLNKIEIKQIEQSNEDIEESIENKESEDKIVDKLTESEKNIILNPTLNQTLQDNLSENKKELKLEVLIIYISIGIILLLLVLLFLKKLF